MSTRLALAAASSAFLLATAVSAGAQSAPRNQAAPAQANKYSCLPQDENGRNLPNPNAAFICGQINAHATECEMQAKAGNAKALALHCFGFETATVAPPAEARVSYSSGRNSR